MKTLRYSRLRANYRHVEMCKSKALQFFISENDRTEQTFYVIALGFFQLEIFHNLVSTVSYKGLENIFQY